MTRIDAISARLKAATPECGCEIIHHTLGAIIAQCPMHAHAPADLTYLIERVRRLEVALSEGADALNNLLYSGPPEKAQARLEARRIYGSTLFHARNALKEDTA